MEKYGVDYLTQDELRLLWQKFFHKEPQIKKNKYFEDKRHAYIKLGVYKKNDDTGNWERTLQKYGAFLKNLTEKDVNTWVPTYKFEENLEDSTEDQLVSSERVVNKVVEPEKVVEPIETKVVELASPEPPKPEPPKPEILESTPPTIIPPPVEPPHPPEPEPPQPKPRRFEPTTQNIIGLLGALVIILILVVIYLILSRPQTSTIVVTPTLLPVAQATQSPVATQLPAVVPPTSAPNPTPIPPTQEQPTSIPTQPTATNLPLPSDTPVPTVVIPPEGIVIFKTDFQNGYPTDWQLSDPTQPLPPITNGVFFTDKMFWFSVGAESFTNYRITIITTGLELCRWEQSVISLRTTSNNSVWFTFCEVFESLEIHSNGEITHVQSSDMRNDGKIISIEVVGDKFSHSGSDSIIMGFPNGKIVFGLQKGMGVKEITVIKLP